MRTSARIPIALYAGAAALAALGTPPLAAAAWRAFVWRTPGPAPVASLEELAAVVAVLGLLAGGQLVLLVQRRREVIDAAAAADAARLAAAVRGSLAGVRLAAGVGVLALLAALAIATATQRLVAPAGFDWPAFGLALALLAGPSLAALAAPAWFARPRGTAPADLARTSRLLDAGTLAAAVALGAVLLCVTLGFAAAQSACRPGGSAALCGAGNASLGALAGLVGPVAALPALAVAGRAVRALWAVAHSAPPR